MTGEFSTRRAGCWSGPGRLRGGSSSGGYRTGLTRFRGFDLGFIYACRYGNGVIVFGYCHSPVSGGYTTGSLLSLLPLQLSLPGCSAATFSRHEQVSPEGVYQSNIRPIKDDIQALIS